MESLTFDQKLQRYAELIIKVGVNLQPGQRLFILALPLEVAPLVREVTKCAYQNGCKLVTVQWEDELLDPIRYQYAPRDSFEEIDPWTTNGFLQQAEQGQPLLEIAGLNPELLKDQDPDLIAIANRTRAKQLKPFMEYLRKDYMQWSIVYIPTPEWANKVFPQLSPREAEERLWDEVFKACRLDKPDPPAFWKQQIANLGKRKDYLTAKGYIGLKYTAPGTDLTVGFPKGHIWCSGEGHTPKGIPFVANLPTEEVFTMPHKDKTEGTVTATKPLSYRGNLIENFSLTFSEGKVVNFSAQKGEETLRKLLETDENATQLGEVALVPHQTPISQSGLVFLSTLYDENASNHLALGTAYRFTLEGGEQMSDEEFAQAGGNDSLIHVDFMFGSGEMDVNGLLADGTSEPVMRAGEWAFEV